MAKSYHFYTPTKSVDIEVITDATDKHKTFTVTDIVRENALARKKGFNIPNLGIHVTEQYMLSLALSSNLTCDVYNDGKFVEQIHEWANDEAEILTYGFASIGDAVYDIMADRGIIHVTVPAQTVITSLVATFTISSEASIAIGSTPQVSGTTSNNFTNPVIYTVTSDFGNSKNWTVIVEEEVVTP